MTLRLQFCNLSVGAKPIHFADEVRRLFRRIEDVSADAQARLRNQCSDSNSVADGSYVQAVPESNAEPSSTSAWRGPSQGS
jgi:hypothetical protein